ncbi:MAG: O-antigen ligase family protein, partial [bacterium]|nr:O-antigen ligase family protein [bacterium]
FILLAVSIFFPSAVYLWSGVLVQSTVFVFLAISIIPMVTPTGSRYLPVSSPLSRGRRYYLLTTRTLLIYVLFSAISIFTAYYRNGNWHGWFILLLGFLIYWLLVTPTVSRYLPRYISGRYGIIGIGLVLLGVLEAGYGIYQYVYGFNYTIRLITQNPVLVSSQYYEGILHALQTHRIIGTFGNPNIYALFLAMIFPISTFYFLNDTNIKPKLLFLLSTAIILTALGFTYSRGGILCAIGGILPLAILLRNKFNIKKFLWILGLVLLTAILILVCTQFPKSELKSAKLETFSARLAMPTSTVSERLHYWSIAKQMITDHPILGTGIGSFGIRYGRYKPVGIGETKYAHNLFLQIWVEQGILGLLSFLGLLIVLIYLGIKQFQRVNSGFSIAIFGGLLAFIVDGFFGFGYYTPELYYLFCFLLGIFVNIPKPSELELDTLEKEKRKSCFWLLTSSVLLFFLAIIWYFAIYSPYLGQLYFNTARNQLAANQLIPAVAGYRAALVCEPSNSEYHQHLGNTLLQLNQVEEGIRHLELAVKLNPYTAYYHSDLAEAYRSVGRYPKAEREVQLAISNYPNKPAYHYQLAQIYAQQGKEELATQEMLRFAELSK